jgi:hypothetical protein
MAPSACRLSHHSEWPDEARSVIRFPRVRGLVSRASAARSQTVLVARTLGCGN